MENKMELPKRSKEQIKETIAFNRFNRLVPPSWIIRDIRALDYGVDFLVEIVSLTNRVLPYIVRIQSKYHEKIEAPIYIKRTTFNYLSQGNNASFLFASNDKMSKIVLMNDRIDNTNNKNIRLDDNKFYYISTIQDLLNNLCYDTYRIINKYGIIKYYNYVAKIFYEIFISIKNNDTRNMASIYSSKSRYFNQIYMYNFKNISLFSDYIKPIIMFDDLKHEIKDIDKIIEIMKISLISVCCFSKKYNLYTNVKTRSEFISYLKDVSKISP